jgi:PilZ domain
MELISESLECFIPRLALTPDQPSGQDGAERRRAPRFATNQITLLHSNTAAGLQRVFCRIVDFSARGLRVRTDRRLEVGTELRVTLREMFAIGTVRYCNTADGCFDHGIEINEVHGTADLVPQEHQEHIA